jgi:RNA methyltransferase, TrmH family
MMEPGIPRLSKARFKRYLKLHQKKFRDSEGMFIAEGLRTVKELCSGMPSPGMLEALLLRENGGPVPDLAGTYGDRTFSITEAECSALSGTTTSQGIIGIFRKPGEMSGSAGDSGAGKAASCIIAFDDVQDPGNAGTIMRTAAWFGCDAMIWSRGSADPFNAKTVRSSAGSMFTIHHYQPANFGDELERLKKKGYTVVAAALDGRDFREFAPWPSHVVLVIGNEANGVSARVRLSAQMLVRIPHGGAVPHVESLNASVSAGILIERIVLGQENPERQETGKR